MRTAKWVGFVAIFLAAGLAAHGAHAALIAADDFESLTAGDPLAGAAGGFNWYGTWEVNSAREAEVTVAASGLSYQAGDIAIAGGDRALQYVATENGVTDALAARRAKGAGDVFYMSFLYQTQNVLDGAEPQAPFMQIGMQASAANPYAAVCDVHGAIFDEGQTEPRPRNFALRSGTGGLPSDLHTGVPSPDNQTFLLVMKASKSAESTTYDQLELFVNPTSTVETNNTSFVNTEDSGLDLVGQSAYWVMRKAFMEPDNTFLVDEIKIGDTFADVVTDYHGDDSRTAVTTADGNGADTLVQWYSTSSDPADTNWGGRAYVEVKNAGTEPSLFRKAYFRFDLGALGDAGVDDATLRLTTTGVSSAGQTFNVYALNDGDAGEAWIEGDGVNLNVATDGDPSNDDWITWNNAPANLAGNDVETTRATLLGTFEGVDSGRIVDFASDALRDAINADTDGLLTLIVTRDSFDANFYGDAHQFLTKEGNALQAPTLWLTPSEGGLDGDLNGDGFVGGDDLDIVRSFWGQSVAEGNLEQGDPSGDGFVGGDDLDIVRANWGQGAPPSPTAVPEPQMFLLLVSGIFALTVARRAGRK